MWNYTKRKSYTTCTLHSHADTHRQRINSCTLSFHSFQENCPKRKSEKRKTTALLSFSHSHLWVGKHGIECVSNNKNIGWMKRFVLLCCVDDDDGGNGGLGKTTEYFWLGLLHSIHSSFIRAEFSHWYTDHVEWPKKVREQESTYSKISKCITVKLWSAWIQLRIFSFHSETFCYANT